MSEYSVNLDLFVAYFCGKSHVVDCFKTGHIIVKSFVFMLENKKVPKCPIIALINTLSSLAGNRGY
jgi:hypothetical protein